MAKMKLKTLSGAKKRFKMTASGKIKRNASKRRHILTKKTTKLTRGLRMPKYVDKTNATILYNFGDFPFAAIGVIVGAVGLYMVFSDMAE